MQRLIELTEAELHAVAGGAAVGTATVMATASGTTNATVVGGVLVGTTPTSGTAAASAGALGEQASVATFTSLVIT